MKKIFLMLVMVAMLALPCVALSDDCDPRISEVAAIAKAGDTSGADGQFMAQQTSISTGYLLQAVVLEPVVVAVSWTKQNNDHKVQVILSHFSSNEQFVVGVFIDDRMVQKHEIPREQALNSMSIWLKMWKEAKLVPV